MTIFFYDSYAIIEYLKNNPHFVPYFEEHTGILTIFNLTEVYYAVFREEGEEKAKIVLDILYPLVSHINKETVAQAMKFRYQHKNKTLSYADCVGYTIAQEQGILFLTGDMQFRNMSGVAFVK